ncbi:MAG: D-aminoacyl-tRNA deacylase [Fibrobacterales bacterium]
MKVVLQRVLDATVTIENTNSIQRETIGTGLLVLAGMAPGDGLDDMDWIIKKMTQLRIFDDSEGFMNRSVIDIEGELLIVSQFTLFGTVKKGTRPSFSRAAPPKEAKILYTTFMDRLRLEYPGVIKEGVFAADMKVSLINDGPVTLIIDSKNRDGRL